MGLPFLTTSRLVPADNFRTTEKQTELVDTLIPILDNSQLPLIFVVGTYLFKDDGGTSINPVWRNSLWHVCASYFWLFYLIADFTTVHVGHRVDILELQHDSGREAEHILRLLLAHGRLAQNHAGIRSVLCESAKLPSQNWHTKLMLGLCCGLERSRRTRTGSHL